jgi:serine/threonine protein kinase
MLSHPNIVSVYDVGHSDGMEYIVMELVDGITLKQYMQKKGRAELEGGAAFFPRRSPRPCPTPMRRG